jgi:hypothetical protein
MGWGLRMPRRYRIVTVGAFLAATAVVAGCTHSGSFDVEDSASTKWDALVAVVQFKTPPQGPRPTDPVKCPEIFVLEGTSADRVFKTGSEGSNDALLHQFSINEVARDCQVDNSQIAMKIGVQGKVLMGPAGAPGSFSVPIRVVVVRVTDQSPVISKLYHTQATIASGQTQGDFTLVTEPLSVPYTNAVHDYTIKVGFDSAVENSKKKAAAAQTQPANAAAPQQASSGQQHHHHRHTDQSQTQ